LIDVSRDLERMRDYIAGRMTDSERREFEESLVRDPEAAREIEESVRLSEGLRELQAQGYFRKEARKPREFGLWLPTAAAAAIAGVALLLWLRPVTESPGVLMVALDSQKSPSAAPLVSAHFTLVATRGGSSQDLDLPASGVVEFRVVPAADSRNSSYRMALVHENGAGSTSFAGSLARVGLSADGYLHVYADAVRLSPGHYVLSIESGSAAAGTVEDFRFMLHTRGAGGDGR
jgi:hypothetical protein